MKKTILLLLISFFYLAKPVHAQNWIWAVGGLGGSEGLMQAIDPWGNVFEGGRNNNASTNDTFGSVIMSGYGYNTSMVIKYDPNGNLIWARNTMGGTSRPLGIATDIAGNLYLLAWYAEKSISIPPYTIYNSSGDTGTVVVFLAKFSPTGDVIWLKNLCNTVADTSAYFGQTGSMTIIGTDIYIAATFLDSVINFGPYVFRNSDPTETTHDFILAKLDSGGNIKWGQKFGGLAEEDCYSITSTQKGNLFISGNFLSSDLTFGSTTLSSAGGNLFVVKLDSTGNVIWAKSPDGFGSVYYIASDGAEDAYITGNFHGPLKFGSVTLATDTLFYDAYLGKYDSSGNAVWAKQIPGNQNIEGYGITVDPCGNVWLACSMNKDSIAIVDSNIVYAPTGSRDPMFITGWDVNGNYIMSLAMPSGGDDQILINSDGAGNLIIGGDFWGGPYTFGSFTLNDPAHGYEDIFALKFKTVFVKDSTLLNTLVCIKDSGLLQAPAGYPNYLWSDGSIAPSHKVDTSGTWTVYCTGNCNTGVVKEVFTVNYGKLDTTFQSQDTFMCINSQLTLTAPGGYHPYLWQDGNNQQKDIVYAPGNYPVVCFGTCTIPTVLDTFHVALKSEDWSFSIGPPDTSVCSPLVLSAPDSEDNYLWQDGTTSYSYTVTAPGIYSVDINKNGCHYSDSVNVEFPDLTQHLGNRFFCEYHPIDDTLTANVPPGSQALWSTGERQPQIVVTYPGTYWVTVTDDACKGSDTMTITQRPCDCIAIVPLAFTPNDDGKNDFLYPIIDKTCNIYDYTFAVYNRWGQLVFSTHDRDRQWDGKFNNLPADVAVYMYYVEFKVAGSFYKYISKGDITLIR